MSRTLHSYAQARVQARFGSRPVPADFDMLDASRDAVHFRSALRASSLARFAAGPGLMADPDALEARLQAGWRALCAEVGGWYGRSWHRAFALFGAFPDLATLEFLRAAHGPTPAWLGADPRLAAVERSRKAAIGELYGPALAAAFPTGPALCDAWRRDWHASWPGTDPGVARQLAAVGRDHGQAATHDAPALAARASRLERLFRRGAGSPVAGFAYLALAALAVARLRGGHAALLLGDAAPP